MSRSLKPRPTSHLSVRPEGDGADIRVLFSDQATSGTRVLSGTMVHIAAVAILLVVARFIPEKVYNTILPDRLPQDLVWLVDPGPGGGGGGGNKSPDPPKAAEVKGAEKVNVPAVKPPDPEPVPEPEKVPDVPTEPLLTLPVQTMAAASTTSVGAISAGDASSNSRGSGTGSGVGPGTGSGLGPGSGGGTGGGVFNVGNGVSSPVPVFSPDPKYTAEAMRAKVQGLVTVSAVVMPDGSVTDIRIVKSLDQSFGLDEEAKRTARSWRFRPGMRQGEPVAVRILIELEFNLR